MLRMIVVLLLAAAPAWAADRSEGPPGAFTKSLACRVVSRGAGSSVQFIPLADVNLNTVSGRREDGTFATRLHSGRTLTAVVQHVYVRLPRDRFNVTMLLDGKPHLRLNHMDLDIFVETTIDGQAYALHCFGDLIEDAAAVP